MKPSIGLSEVVYTDIEPDVVLANDNDGYITNTAIANFEYADNLFRLFIILSIFVFRFESL